MGSVASEADHWILQRGRCLTPTAQLSPGAFQHGLARSLRPSGRVPEALKGTLSFLGNGTVSSPLRGVAQDRLVADVTHGKALHLAGLDQL